MSNPYAEHRQSEAIHRSAKALERIADALERYAAADPLTVLHEAMQGGDFGEAPVFEPGPTAEPQAPIPSNGFTTVYRLPGTDEWQIVARRHSLEESGFDVTIERA